MLSTKSGHEITKEFGSMAAFITNSKDSLEGDRGLMISTIRRSVDEEPSTSRKIDAPFSIMSSYMKVL
jgi:hypothetical protein